jgi:2-polyprenyl-3-methyl-5-hydroxy-6-metoxy-1,4-benzoquinol methylase
MNYGDFELDSCPVCREKKLELFDKIEGLNQHSDILICNTCHALIAVSSYDALKTKALEDVQNSHFYEDYELARSAHIEGVESGDASIKVLLLKTGIEPGGKTFLDFGAGRGYTAIAATRHFKKVYASEIDIQHISSIAALFELNNLQIVQNLQSIKDPVDVLFMWHTLEHLPDPSEFWMKHASIFSRDAIIHLQIPLYRPGHVVDSHYIFYTEKSLSVWAFSSLKAKPVYFGYDMKNGFLEMIARRDA